MGSWPTMQLDELCEVTSSKRIYATELVPDGVPFLKSKEIIEKVNGQPHTNLLYISEHRFREIAQQTGSIEKGDVLLTSRGTLGVPYVVNATDRFHFADGNLTWFRRLSGLDSNYLRYFLLSPNGKAELSKCVIGSSQQAYTIAALKKAEIPLPPLPIQRRIAGMLSAYDELIENSQRRIKILDSMARALYREWFVHYRFPGHESLPLVPSPLGEIPKGWEVRILGDLCELRKDAYKDSDHSGLPLLDMAHMPSRTLAPSDTGSPSELTTSRIIFQKGDTLFGAIRCYLHKVVAAHFPGVTNTSVLVLRPKSPSFRALVAIVASDLETIRWAETQSTGTKMPVINWGVFQGMPAPIPTRTLAQKFEDIAGPMLDEIGILATQIQNLRRTRDLLLPRLLSGQIDVEAMPS